MRMQPDPSQPPPPLAKHSLHTRAHQWEAFPHSSTLRNIKLERE